MFNKQIKEESPKLTNKYLQAADHLMKGIQTEEMIRVNHKMAKNLLDKSNQKL
jgi:hypothetical protein